MGQERLDTPLTAGCVRRYVRCRNATAEVRLRTFLSPCVDDCGPYGQCKLLRTHNYLYAACECKAGERAGLAREPWAGFKSWRGGLDGQRHLEVRVGLERMGRRRPPFPGSVLGPGERLLAGVPNLWLPWALFHVVPSPLAGWRGWGCTDSADALTYGFQLLSTLLLCLSNLMFLPPVVLAIRSRYVLEAAVYTFTMFFSTVCGVSVSSPSPYSW